MEKDSDRAKRPEAGDGDKVQERLRNNQTLRINMKGDSRLTYRDTRHVQSHSAQDIAKRKYTY